MSHHLFEDMLHCMAKTFIKSPQQTASSVNKASYLHSNFH